MRIALLTLLLLLAGCESLIPVKQHFPKVPAELQQQCEKLRTIEGDSVAITEMLKTVVNNYTLYYECSTRVDGWNTWYNKQKKLFEETNK